VAGTMGQSRAKRRDNVMGYREETDSLGRVLVPEDALFGAQTQRAIENFPISGLRLPAGLLTALALLKRCAAHVNAHLGLLDPDKAEAIAAAAREVEDGRWDGEFPVDVFQTGSGTSTNMNMNEVLASRANERLTGKRGGKSPVHPNDHVNLGQSSNDVIPSCIHIAALVAVSNRLLPSLRLLWETLHEKQIAFKDVKKIGRTHLQDALPVFLGDEFGAYARQVELGIERVEAVTGRLGELALGGTAVGNGVNAHPDFARAVIARVSEITGIAFVEAADHFEAQSAQDASVETSGALRTVAVSLVKIAADLRWMSSGPRCGLGEIILPVLQPGSSIMPGKINPVIPEAVIQVAAQVMGNDLTICLGGQGGNFELNVMLPVMAYNLLQSIELLASASRILAEKCIRGLAANRERCARSIEQSLALATHLVPRIGYDRAALLAKKAFETGMTIRQAALAEGIVSAAEMDDWF